MDPKKTQETQDYLKVAGRTYLISDYHRNDPVSSGLAETHEQFSDAYMEGEIGADINGKDPLPRKGYNVED